MIKVNKYFLILILLSMLLALFFGGNLLYAIFYTLFSLLSFGYLYMLIQKHYIGAEVIFRNRIKEAGDSDECLTIVKCDSVIPVPYIAVKSDIYESSNSGYNGEVLNITSDENAWIWAHVNFYRRGIYNFGKITLDMFDIFRIYQCHKEVDLNIKVKVYPRIYPINKLPFGGRDIYLESFDKHSTNEDMFSIKDVRRYREGDSLKKIHWKVSAKYGEIFVRNSDTISGQEFVIFLNMQRNNHSMAMNGIYEEEMVDMCTSIISFMVSRGIKTRVYINALNIRSFNIGNKEDFNDFIEFLVLQESDGNMDFSEFIYQNFYRFQTINRIAVITTAVDSRLSNHISNFRNSGYSITVFYCRDCMDSDRELGYLKRFGVECMNSDEILTKA